METLKFLMDDIPTPMEVTTLKGRAIETIFMMKNIHSQIAILFELDKEYHYRLSTWN